jgi:hypothetical protein
LPFNPLKISNSNATYPLPAGAPGNKKVDFSLGQSNTRAILFPQIFARGCHPSPGPNQAVAVTAMG